LTICKLISTNHNTVNATGTISCQQMERRAGWLLR
jgi:hypothetical protein